MDDFRTKLLKPFLLAVSFLCFLIVKGNKRKKSAEKIEKNPESK